MEKDDENLYRENISLPPSMPACRRLLHIIAILRILDRIEQEKQQPKKDKHHCCRKKISQGRTRIELVTSGRRFMCSLQSYTLPLSYRPVREQMVFFLIIINILVLHTTLERKDHAGSRLAFASVTSMQ
jgi:hypothetical protein